MMVAAECAPAAHAGGLGDVVFGLSRELELRGNSVEIVLPKYDCLRYDRIHGLTVAYDDLWVPWFGGAIHCTVWFGWVDGRKCFFIEPHSQERFFGRGHLYGSDDDVARFAFFSKAALEFMLKSGKRPEVIHCHDWETALVPVLLFEIYQALGMQDQRVCLTVHNLHHQGVTSEWVLSAVGLGEPARFFDPSRLQDDSNPWALNLLKGGIVYSNFVTTVSPHHAWEARHTDQGAGLGHTLRLHADKFGGILNGVDYDTWNPEVDRWIPRRYSAGAIKQKYVNARALRERFMLRNEKKPVVAYVGRLDHQKGVGLIHHAIFYALAHDAQFVLLGAGSDAEIAARFGHLKHHLNDDPDVHLELRFDHELAHLVYAGADLVVMPEHVRAVRTRAAGRREIRDRADRASDRRSGRHDLRPPVLRRSSRTAQRLRLSTRRPRRAGIGDGTRDRAVAPIPGSVPPVDAQRDAGEPLVGDPRSGLPQRLRLCPA